MVLWMITVLSIIAMMISQSVRTDVKLTAHYKGQLQADTLAESGIWLAAIMAVEKRTLKFKGKAIKLDGTSYDVPDDNGELKVSLQSEDGLIDLNQVPEDVLKGLLSTHEEPQAITEAILDWRDADKLRRLKGAENIEYQKLGVNYEPANANFNSIEQLHYVSGMNEEVYKSIKPYLTVFSGRSKIDITTAPEGVLKALPGATDAWIKGVMKERAEDRWSVNLDSIPIEMKEFVGQGEDEFIRIHSRAQVQSAIANITCIIQMKSSKNQPFTVVSWQIGTSF